MDYIKSIWHWNDYFVKKDKSHFELHTGGWSGNEDIIRAMMDNQVFWIMCWIESKHGGTS